MFRLLNKSAIW